MCLVWNVVNDTYNGSDGIHLYKNVTVVEKTIENHCTIFSEEISVSIDGYQLLVGHDTK